VDKYADEGVEQIEDIGILRIQHSASSEHRCRLSRSSAEKRNISKPSESWNLKSMKPDEDIGKLIGECEVAKSCDKRLKHQKDQIIVSNEPKFLLDEIRRLIEETRFTVAIAVNAGMTILYWRIGKRINEDVLNGKRADYGDTIVSTLSRQLLAEYGNGFSDKSIRHMMKFAESFSDSQIVSTLSRQLSWSHFKEIIYLKQPLQKDFYAEMCRIERWSVRKLRKEIDSMLYERTALSKKTGESC